ncbi:phage tail protein [Jeotgalibacillus aurantiacus]|uniref:phage tail protein n=1 Tax=Jeotgalibacillus aurantiacus TaxID=2763266 RepID=UPI001D0ADFF7|nr:tail fiber protein [Jeotgalibacillus aurantiacus]
MGEQYVGDIQLFPYQRGINGWAECNGQLLSIQSNQALYSIIGTMYGGDGKTTFALPDLRGRVPMHRGPLNPQGTSAGEDQHTLTVNEIPNHTHQVFADSGRANQLSPANNIWGTVYSSDTSTDTVNAYSANGDTVMSDEAIATAGASSPHTNMQPYLTMMYYIALNGYYPSRG